jgi:hypothetical protein
MSFTYNFATAPAISYVRLLIPDTDQANPIFSDEEITAFMYINQATWQSSMYFSAFAGSLLLPSNPSNYLRAAALALRSLAGNASRLAGIIQLLDVKLSNAAAVKALHDTADSYLKMDDESGAIAIAEQVNTVWAWRDRWIAQFQRMSGGGPIV